MNDRTDFDNAPTAPGWYGTISGDGEGEVWVGVAYWDGGAWQGPMSRRVYERSVQAFATKEEAWDWACAQPD